MVVVAVAEHGGMLVLSVADPRVWHVCGNETEEKETDSPMWQ